MKTKKLTPGISRTIQKTFIIVAGLAYLSQLLLSIQGLINVPDMVETLALTQLPLYLIDSLLLPLVLFTFAYLIFNTKISKVARLFQATFIAGLGSIMSVVISIAFMQLFNQQLGYSNDVAIWSSQWVQLIPMLFTLVFMAGITLYLATATRKVEFTASRTVQWTLIALIGFALIMNGIATSVLYMSSGNANAIANVFESYAFLIASLGLVIVPVTIIYLVASKTTSRLSRVFTALVYVLIGLFLATAMGSVLFILETSIDGLSATDSAAFPALVGGIFITIVAVQKMRKAF